MLGRIDEVGREMAKFATSPGMLSTMPSRVSVQAVSTPPQTNLSFAIHTSTSSSIIVHSHSLPSLYLPHLFLPRPPPTRIGQPTIYPSLCHPRRTTTITSAVPNGRPHISLRFRSSRSRRALDLRQRRATLDVRRLSKQALGALDPCPLPAFPRHL